MVSLFLARLNSLLSGTGFLSAGPSYPVTLDDLDAVQGMGIGDFQRVVSGLHHRLGDFISDPAKIDEEFRKAWLPYYCRSGQREASLEEFDREVQGWLPLLPGVALPRLTGQMLADVVQRIVFSRLFIVSARMGQLDGWIRSWVPDSVFSAGSGRGSVEAWYISALTLRKFLLVLLTLMFISLLLT